MIEGGDILVSEQIGDKLTPLLLVDITLMSQHQSERRKTKRRRDNKLQFAVTPKMSDGYNYHVRTPAIVLWLAGVRTFVNEDKAATYKEYLEEYIKKSIAEGKYDPFIYLDANAKEGFMRTVRRRIRGSLDRFPLEYFDEEFSGDNIKEKVQHLKDLFPY